MQCGFICIAVYTGAIRLGYFNVISASNDFKRAIINPCKILSLQTYDYNDQTKNDKLFLLNRYLIFTHNHL